MSDTFKFELEGLTFRANIRHDEGMREPWRESDGHGIVSEWTSRDKRAGERVLIADRGSARFYNVKESIAVALRDGWGCRDAEGMTKRQVAAAAVEQDYKRLKAWCNDEWHWVYVTVELLSKNGDVVPGFRESCGGMESDQEEQDFRDMAEELAGEIAAQVGDKQSIALAVR